MKRFIWLLSLLTLAALPAAASDDEKKDARKLLSRANQVLQEALGGAAATSQQPMTQPTDPQQPTPQQPATGASAIPQDELAQAKCVAVIPSATTGAVAIGFSHGDGVITCRSGQSFDGEWSPPAIIELQDVSLGAQAGGKESDMIVLVTSNEAAQNILDDNFKFSADASAVAATERPEAEDTDRDDMNEGVRVYSRTEGVFAGAAITGGSLDANDDANESLYGREIKAREILSGTQVTPPAAAQEFLSTLKQHTMTKEQGTQPHVPPAR